MKVCQSSENFNSLKKLILQPQLSFELSQIQKILSAYSELFLFFAEYSFLFEALSQENQLDKPQVFTQDPARDGSNWYAYCSNNPLTFVDPNELWESKNQWNEDFQNKYHDSVNGKIAEYERNNQKFTCEDLALSLLIDFASENSLPLKIRNGTGFYNSNDKKFTDPEVYKEKVLSTTAARSLLDYTVQVDKNDIKPGDLILMDDGWGTGLLEGKNNRLDNKPSHTQVIENNVEGILKIKQGNFDEGSYIYGSKDYGGEIIAERTLDLNTDTFYKNRNDGKNNAEKRYGIWYRRWNFESFNDLNVQPIDEKSMSPRMKHEMSK